MRVRMRMSRLPKRRLPFRPSESPQEIEELKSYITRFQFIKIATPRLVLPHLLNGDENDEMESVTLSLATDRGMLFLCQWHRRKFPAESTRLFNGLCKPCESSVLADLAKFLYGEIPWFLLKPCETCKKLPEVVVFFEVQRTLVLTWNL